jgi:hypothetical protein
MAAVLVFVTAYVILMGLALSPALAAWYRGIPTGTQGCFSRASWNR